MTFEEFSKYYIRDSKKTYEIDVLKSLYEKRGPYAWTSNIHTKEMVTVNSDFNKMTYKDLSIEDELERAKNFHSLYNLNEKRKKIKQAMENLKKDFK